VVCQDNKLPVCPFKIVTPVLERLDNCQELFLARRPPKFGVCQLSGPVRNWSLVRINLS
jgi:hypothetical protein